MNWARFVISGSIGFIIAIVMAICIERCGGAIGGVISSVPTTILPTFVCLFTGGGADASSNNREPLCRSHRYDPSGTGEH